MLYYLFEYLDKLNIPGAGVFSYISFRSAAAVITSLFISMMIGKRIIRYLQRKQVGEVVRDLGLEGQYRKQGTPSMGGIIILASIVIPALLFARLDNIYVIIMLITTLWLGLIGFVDDYIKVFRKSKEGLAGRFKITGQIVLGLIVGITLCFSDEVMIAERVNLSELTVSERNELRESPDVVPQGREITLERKSTKTTIPFIKNNEFNYSWLVSFIKKDNRQPRTWLVYILVIIFILTAVYN